MIPRTPRNYFGRENPAKKGADLLPEILREIGSKAADQSGEIFQYWYIVLGEKMAPLTEPISYVDGVLTVKVKSSTLYSLLCQYEKPRLLGLLQGKFPVRSLVFRAG